MELTLRVNGERHQLDVDPEMPLLWVLREVLDLTGTKFACGVAACGACTVHVDGRAMRTCTLPVATVADKDIITIEGLTDDLARAVQRAWLQHQVPQCGYCQSGMIMAAIALLREQSAPSDDDIDRAITNICRCGTYQRIRAAIHALARGDV